MDSYAKLYQTMKQAFGNHGSMSLLCGRVKSVEDDTCTVDFGNENILTGVRLKVQIGGDDDRLLITPVIGKMVLCGSLSNDLTDLVMLKAERIEKIQWDENGVQVKIDTQTGKLSIKNETVSLKDLFDEMKSIIESLKVYTPVGPSGTPLPDTIISLDKFQNKVNTLLN